MWRNLRVSLNRIAIVCIPAMNDAARGLVGHGLNPVEVVKAIDLGHVMHRLRVHAWLRPEGGANRGEILCRKDGLQLIRGAGIRDRNPAVEKLIAVGSIGIRKGRIVEGAFAVWQASGAGRRRIDIDLFICAGRRLPVEGKT